MQRYAARTEKQARQSLRFLSSPLSRSYIFTYHYGRELLGRYIAAGDRIARFQTLLEQLVTPSRVEQWINGAPGSA